MAQFFGRDVHQKIFAAWIIFGQCLREISSCRSQFALGATELFEQQIGQARIRLSNTYGVLETLVM